MSEPTRSDDVERALFAERILAEQEERRRLAELLHDGPVGDLADGGSEPDLIEGHRLEAGDDATELVRRVPRDRERTRRDGSPTLEVVRVEGVRQSVEHLRERGDVLDGAVVELLRDPASLGALREQALRDVVIVAQSIIASRSAMATAWVRVSASSFARM